MRVIALTVMAASAAAHADAKQYVDKLVRAEARPVETPGRIGPYGAFASNVKHDVQKLVVVVDAPHHVAWFHAAIDASYDFTPCDGMGEHCEKTRRVHKPRRLSGVARDDGGWKLAATMWSDAIADADLFKLAQDDVEPKKGDPGDTDPGKVVAHWFDGGSIARDISSSAQAIANGTAPTEIAQGAGAAKLAKAWDGLKMWGENVAAQQWGTIAFVETHAWLPAKKKRSAVRMKLGVVLVQENGNWRWVSINFAPPDAP